MNINLKQLRFAIAVADKGSFTEAASECFVTQPTLSNGIAQLEAELGDRLFVRTTRKVTLTTFGEQVMPYMAEVLRAQTTLELQPADAFGLRDEDLVRTIPKTQFPPGVKVGGQLEGRGEDGQTHAFTVTKIKGDTVLLDGNHPLAGKALRFNLTVTEVRKASEEEIAHRHVHGEHGHHH